MEAIRFFRREPPHSGSGSSTNRGPLSLPRKFLELNQNNLNFSKMALCSSITTFCKESENDSEIDNHYRKLKKFMYAMIDSIKRIKVTIVKKFIVKKCYQTQM